jgi:hypothetical protein
MGNGQEFLCSLAAHECHYMALQGGDKAVKSQVWSGLRDFGSWRIRGRQKTGGSIKPLQY